MQELTYPMHWAWRACLLLAIGVGLVAAGLAIPELAGWVEFGSLLRAGSRAEVVVALVVGLAFVWFAGTAWRHARLTLGSETLSFLKFGFVCGTGSLRLADVRRWGHGVVSVGQGRRERHLLVELLDRSTVDVRLSMYAGIGGFAAEFETRTAKAPQAVKQRLQALAFEADE